MTTANVMDIPLLLFELFSTSKVCETSVAFAYFSH